MKISGLARVGIFITGCVIAFFVIDPLVVRPHLPSALAFLTVKLDPVLLGGSYPLFQGRSALTLFLFPFVLLALAILPYQSLRNRRNWAAFGGVLWRLALFELLAPIFFAVLAFAFTLAEDYLPPVVSKGLAVFGIDLTWCFAEKCLPKDPIQGNSIVLLFLLAALYYACSSSTVKSVYSKV